MKKTFIYSDTAHSWIPNKIFFFLTEDTSFAFYLPDCNTEIMSLTKKKWWKLYPKPAKRRKLDKGGTIKTCRSVFHQLISFLHGTQWPQKAACPTADHREFSEPLGKKVQQLPNLHLLFLPFTELSPQNSVITDCLLVRARAWHTICLCMGTPEHNSHIPGGAEIPGSSLWSGNGSPYRRFDVDELAWVWTGGRTQT